MKLSANNKTAIDLMLPIGAGALVFYNIYKKNGDVKEAGIIAGIVAVVAYVITTQVTRSILIATTNSLSTSKKNEIAQEYGASTKDVEAAQERARIIHIAFYGVDGKQWDEDEDTAIATINQCKTPADVKLTCSLYQSAYAKSLAGDFSRYISGYNEWSTPINPIVKPNWF